MASRRAADAVDAPRRRGRPPVISRSAVVDAGLTVAERVGLENLTMRLLADELGTSMMAAYTYVPTKQALVALVAEAVLARVEVPDRASGPWDERLSVLAHDLRENLRRYPGVSDALRAVHAEGEATRLGRGITGILRDAGFKRAEAEAGLVTFYKLMIGQMRFDDATTPAFPQPKTQLDADELFDFGLETMLGGLRERLRVSRRD